MVGQPFARRFVGRGELQLEAGGESAPDVGPQSSCGTQRARQGDNDHRAGLRKGVDRVTQFLLDVGVAGQAVDVVDGKQPATAQAVAKLAHGVGLDRVGKRVTEVGRGEVLGTFGAAAVRTAALLPRPHESAGEMRFTGAAGAVDGEHVGGRAAIVELEQSIDRAGDESVFAPRHEAAQRHALLRSAAVARRSRQRPAGQRDFDYVVDHVGSVRRRLAIAPGEKIKRRGRAGDRFSRPDLRSAEEVNQPLGNTCRTTQEILPESGRQRERSRAKITPVFVAASRCTR